MLFSNFQLSDDPPYYAIGTEVSARFRGAFCEARIKAVQLAVTFTTFSFQLSCDDGIIELDVRLIRGFIKAGSQVEFVDPGTQQTRTGVIVNFDGGDERMLRRSQLCLKGGKHFLQALNSVPLTSPEQFSSPVKLTMSRSVRRNRRHQRSSVSSHAVKRALTFLETSEVPSVTEGSSKQPGPSSQGESSSDEEAESSDSESEEDMELKNLFVAHLYKFMDERGTPINKCPSLGGRDLDLHALYRKVQDLGGYTRVSHKNLWKMLLDQLRSKLGPSVTVKSLKSAYIK
ncbi:ARID domain containing protein [Trichuris trichiura]|uniref:ARID domain containing protein n=1 Tax=Trichuris trichiura TaxID=36087 RepID=A0A077Z536_TRITR|nr:ARID domain containing protein [Trichuris trichiura]